jgi:hypothetical protein
MENDKTAGWLVILTFLAFSLAIMFAMFELNELQANNLFKPIEKLF